MTLIAVSASQGQGKSTVLTSLQELGYNVIPQKTSRSILNDWGFTLNQVNSVKFLTQKFQDIMIERHYENVKKFIGIQDNKFYFQERSLADIFSYALNILGVYNEYNDWVEQYYEKCKKMQQTYDCVIFLSGRRNLIPEDDGVRSVNRQFSTMIDMLINHYVKDFDNGNVLYVDTPNHDERIKMITMHLEELQRKANAIREDSLNHIVKTVALHSIAQIPFDGIPDPKIIECIRTMTDSTQREKATGLITQDIPEILEKL